MSAGTLSLATLRRIHEQPTALKLTTQDRGRIAAASRLVDEIVASGDAAYGINTGFGLLAQTRIAHEQLEMLQRNLLLSHAAGVGDRLPDATVLLVLGQVSIRVALKRAEDGLRAAGLKPIKLRAKEGLALINGTQVSTALGLAGLFGAQDGFFAGVIAGGGAGRA